MGGVNALAFPFATAVAALTAAVKPAGGRQAKVASPAQLTAKSTTFRALLEIEPAPEKRKSSPGKPAEAHANVQVTDPGEMCAPAERAPRVWTMPHMPQASYATPLERPAPAENSEAASEDPPDASAVAEGPGKAVSRLIARIPGSKPVTPRPAQICAAAEAPPNWTAIAGGQDIAPATVQATVGSAEAAPRVAGDVTPNAGSAVISASTAPLAMAAPLAFSGRLRTNLTELTPRPASSEAQQLAKPPTERIAPTAQTAGTASEPRQAVGMSTAAASNDSRHGSKEQVKSAEAPDVEAERPATPVTPQLVNTVATPAPLEHASMPAHAAPPTSVPPPVPARLETPSSPAAPAPAGIQLALNDNGQRVELRVVERAGDIHVAVRTTDPQLRSAMQQELPALSARLEESGYHGDLWRPAAGLSGETRALETAGGHPSSDSGQDSGGRRRQQDSEEQQKQAQQNLPRKPDRKEFSWLFESIR